MNHNIIVFIGLGIGGIGVFIGSVYGNVNPIIPITLFIVGIIIMNSYRIKNQINKIQIKKGVSP